MTTIGKVTAKDGVIKFDDKGVSVSINTKDGTLTGSVTGSGSVTTVYVKDKVVNGSQQISIPGTNFNISITSDGKGSFAYKLGELAGKIDYNTYTGEISSIGITVGDPYIVGASATFTPAQFSDGAIKFKADAEVKVAGKVLWTESKDVSINGMDILDFISPSIGSVGRILKDAPNRPELDVLAPTFTPEYIHLYELFLAADAANQRVDGFADVLPSLGEITTGPITNTTTNLYNLTTNNTPTAGLTPQQDATSGGASSAGNGLVADLNFNASVNFSLLGDVNTAGGNTAVFNYGVSDGLRPGNGNLGLNINASSGQGLKVPINSTILGDYSLYGADLNNAAAANFQLIPTDPLVLDLNGDGVKLTNYTDAPVLFDADNDGGSLEQTGWVSSADGIVVHDLNGDGKINNMGETLSEYYNGVAGSGGVAGTKPYANGFAALKSLDSNADNQFTALDAAWNNLRVWVDANHDGKTDAAELKTFAQLVSCQGSNVV